MCLRLFPPIIRFLSLTINASVPGFNLTLFTNNKEPTPRMQEELKVIAAHLGDFVKPTLSKADMSSTSLTKEEKLTPVVNRKYKKNQIVKASSSTSAKSKPTLGCLSQPL